MRKERHVDMRVGFNKHLRTNRAYNAAKVHYKRLRGRVKKYIRDEEIEQWQEHEKAAKKLQQKIWRKTQTSTQKSAAWVADLAQLADLHTTQFCVLAI